MAAKIAADSDTLQSINDVSEIYDAYFLSVRKDFASRGGIDNQSLLKVAAIVSFFYSVDRKDRNQMALVATVAGMSEDEVWGLVKELHEIEVLDLYEDEIARVSDQVLSTYMSYLSLVREKTLDFGVLLRFLFPIYKRRFVDILNPMFSAFGYEQTRAAIERAVVDEYHASKQSDGKRALSLLESFWFVLQTESLIYAEQEIALIGDPESILEVDALEPVSNPYNPPERDEDAVLRILSNFSRLNPTTIGIAAELLLQYSAKDHSKARSVVRILTSSFGFEHDSYATGFHVQHIVIDCVLRLIGEARAKYLAIGLVLARTYLGTHSESQENHGRSVTLRQFNVPATPDLLKLRDKCWTFLLNSHEDEFAGSAVERCIRRYAQDARRRADRNVILHDANHLISFFTRLSETVRGSLTFAVSLTAYRCFNLLERYDVHVPLELRGKFYCMPYSLFVLSSETEKAFRFRGCSDKEYDLKATAEVHNCFLNFSAFEYVHAAHAYAEIAGVLENDNSPGDVSDGIFRMLSDLSRKSMSMLDEVLRLLPRQGRIVEMIRFFVPALMGTVSAERVWGIIQKLPVPNRHAHELDYFRCVAEDDIRRCDIDRLCALFDVVRAESLWWNIEFTDKFERKFPGSLALFLRQLVKRWEGDDHFTLRGMLSERFVPHVLSALGGDVPLLKRLCFAAVEDCLHHGSCQDVLNEIIDRDPGFVEELVAHDWKGGGRTPRCVPEGLFSFLWIRADSAALADRIVDFAVRQHRDRPWSGVDSLDHLFLVDWHEGGCRNSSVLDSRNAYLADLIARRSRDPEVMRIVFQSIADLDEAVRRKCLAVFLEGNPNFSDFTKLDLLPAMTSGGGDHGMVFAHLAKVEYLESLLPLVCGVGHLRHRAHVEEMVREGRDRAESERRRAFRRVY